MANRMWLPHAGCLEVDVVTLFCKIVVGASGAVTSGAGKGIVSVTKETSAGQYTVLLSDPYHTLLGCSFALLDDADAAAAVGTAFRLNSEAVATAAAPTLVIQASDTATGADANLTDGAILYVTIQVRNSSVA